MTQLAAGWYPDPADPSRQRYFDGQAWTEAFAPIGAPVPGQSGTGGSNAGKKTASTIGAIVLVVIGFIISMQSVSLLTGSSPVWTGVGVVAAGTAASFFLPTDKWVRVFACVALVLSLANAVYIENELSEKRSELNQIFGN